MKKNLLLFTLLAVASVSFTSCKKKGCTDATAVNYNDEAKKDDESCLYKPIITINGASSVTISVGTAYTDAGATAVNKDGSAVTVTTDDSEVDVTTTGVYYVYYSATNANGTTTAKRKVNVVIGADTWLATWALTSTCSTTQFPLSGSPAITAGATANTLVFDNMFNLVGGTANATINGSTVTMSEQTVNITVGDVIFSGTGTMNSTGTQFQITYNYENTTPVIGGTGTCIAIYDKQ